jgi:signal transduction histidine kinase
VPLENAGLIEALKKQCEALGFRTGARVEFKPGVLPATECLPPGGHEAVLRVAQEALANIGRHARASHVMVSLTSIRGNVELRIEDDGAGFQLTQSPRGQGIRNMRSRAEEFGGTLDVESQPGEGTSIVFAIPYTSVDPPEEYRRKAVMFGVIFAILGGLCTWKIDVNFAVLAAISGLLTVRYVVAWRRVLGGAR